MKKDEIVNRTNYFFETWVRIELTKTAVYNGFADHPVNHSGTKSLREFTYSPF